MTLPWDISGLTLRDAMGTRLDEDPDTFTAWVEFRTVVGLCIRALLTGSTRWEGHL